MGSVIPMNKNIGLEIYAVLHPEKSSKPRSSLPTQAVETGISDAEYDYPSKNHKSLPKSNTKDRSLR